MKNVWRIVRMGVPARNAAICRTCRQAIDEKDLFGASEKICEPCRHEDAVWFSMR